MNTIPKLLRKRQQWVVWRTETRNGSKPTKIPYQSNAPEAKASTTDSSTWSSYEQAIDATRNFQFDGVGFVFSDDDPYFGIDFDNVCNVAGEIDADAMKYINGLDTYIEYSPSGLGLHAIALGSTTGRKKTMQTPWGGGLEMYDRGRYFAMTGDRYPTASSIIKNIDVQPLRQILNSKADVTSVSQPKQGSRHPELVAMGADLMRAGTPREVVEEVLRAKAGLIGLPNRERDEVGRIVEWLFSSTSLENRVARAAEQLVVQDAARTEFNRRIMDGRHSSLAHETISLTDLLAEPDVPIQYVIDGLWELGSNVLFSARRKLGKTTFILNLMKSLCDSVPFLNTFNVEAPDGKILYLNYELQRETLKRWMRTSAIENIDRVIIKNVRVGGLPFWHDHIREEVAELCQAEGVWLIVIDPLSVAAQGFVENENDNMRWTQFQTALDQLKAMAGISSGLIVHHIGKSDQAGARGGSQIEGWAEHLWYLERNEADPYLTARSFRSEGRDSGFQPIELSYNEETHSYAWDGATRVEAHKDGALIAWLLQLMAHKQISGDWPKTTEAKAIMEAGVGVGGSNAKKQEYMDLMEKQGFVIKTKRRISGGDGSGAGPGRKAIEVSVTEMGMKKANRAI